MAESNCTCGHPYHGGVCPVVVPGYEWNEPCGCIEYEPKENE